MPTPTLEESVPGFLFSAMPAEWQPTSPHRSRGLGAADFRGARRALRVEDRTRMPAEGWQMADFQAASRRRAHQSTHGAR